MSVPFRQADTASDDRLDVPAGRHDLAAAA